MDFRIMNEGSLVLFAPVSEAAIEFAAEAFAAAMMFGGSYVVEPRYAGPIIDDLVDQGFELEVS